MTSEEAIQWLKNEKWENANNKYKKEWNEAFELAIDALKFAEHFDLLKEFQSLQEVVRCKDCKFKSLYEDDDDRYYYCALEDRPNRNWSVDDTDFCSWGERREP